MPRSHKINFLDKFSYLISDNLVPILNKCNIHPNLVTLLGFVPIYFIYIYILQKKVFLTFLFAFINYTLDCMDGELARLSKKTSKLGGLLDSLHDITSLYTILYLIFGYKAIVILIIFITFFLLIFKMDPVTHKAERFVTTFSFLHDNLNYFYYLTIGLALYFI